MSDYVLWKQLTRTDFNSMHGTASPFGRGGGARHIALGVSTRRFPIEQFLSVGNRSRLSIQVESKNFGSAPLVFASIPGRRHGEWMIADQLKHRHPAWTEDSGFPTKYNPANPPVILVFRTGEKFHARLATLKQLNALATELPHGATQKGITPATDVMLSNFNVSPVDLMSSFQEYLTNFPPVTFDPGSLEDAREKQLAVMVRRQGQGSFRKALLSAYSERCVMTRTRTSWVLEAAHIVPYLGKKTNVLPNGLLLRADVHTLFDLGLISIEPNERRITISKVLQQSPYRGLHGRPVLQPNRASAQPSADALAYHYSRFRK